MHRCLVRRSFTDRAPSCRLIAGYALTVALLALAVDRAEELHTCWGVPVGLVADGMVLA